MAIEVVRLLIPAAHHPKVVTIDVEVEVDVATYLNNRKRREISRLEDETEVAVQIVGREGLQPEEVVIVGRDKDSREVALAKPALDR
jgi:ribonuclease E